MVRTVQPATVVDVVRAFQVELKDTKDSQKVNGTPANVESVVVLSGVWFVCAADQPEPLSVQVVYALDNRVCRTEEAKDDCCYLGIRDPCKWEYRKEPSYQKPCQKQNEPKHPGLRPLAMRNPPSFRSS